MSILGGIGEFILQIEGLFQEKCVILNFTSHMKTKIDEQY